MLSAQGAPTGRRSTADVPALERDAFSLDTKYYRRCSYPRYSSCAATLLQSGVEAAFAKLGGKELYAEEWADFAKELAVIVRAMETFSAFSIVEALIEFH